jgi:hypothetical protein
MLAGLRRVHTCFSEEEEVAQLRNGSPQTVLSMSEEMAKRRIHSMWITASHSLLYTFLLSPSRNLASLGIMMSNVF